MLNETDSFKLKFTFQLMIDDDDGQMEIESTKDQRGIKRHIPKGFICYKVKTFFNKNKGTNMLCFCPPPPYHQEQTFSLSHSKWAQSQLS